MPEWNLPDCGSLDVGFCSVSKGKILSIKYHMNKRAGWFIYQTTYLTSVKFHSEQIRL